MDTAQQALFRAMLNGDWFTASAGDVESPTGYFGYVVNTASELGQIREEFSDVIGAYGPVSDDELIGAWFASIDSNGVVRIDQAGTFAPETLSIASLSTPAGIAARKRFETAETEYSAWGRLKTRFTETLPYTYLNRYSDPCTTHATDGN